MASAQVLPNSVAGSAKKNELLLAGKRRLEEFRKKKAAAAAAAKNSSSNNVSEVNTNEKKPVEDDHGRVMDSTGAGTSGGHGNVVTESSSVAMNGSSIRESELLSSNDIHNSSLSVNDYKSVQYDEPFIYSNDHEFKGVGDIGFGRNGNGPPDYIGGLGRFSHDSTTLDQSVRLNSQGSQDFGGGTGPGIVESRSKEEMNSSRDYTSSNSGSTRVSVSRISPQNSVSSLFLSDITNVDGSKPSSLYEDLIRPTTGKKGFPDTSQTTHSSTNFGDILSSSALYGTENGDAQIYGSGSYESNFQSPPNHIPSYPVTNETYPRKSRPSFLDNLSINRASSGPQFQKEEFEKDSFKSNSLSPFHTPSMNADSLGPFSKHDSLIPLPSHNHLNNSGFDNLPHSSVYENGVDMNHEFYLAPKRNEDFSTLEQHIEDLTHEKFSLQRALETSSVLAESLASENSSLTESYNQQRGVVDQLKSDMENLQGEIKTQLVELDALRNDYANAELECNAADERAKLLASEVITLEEKALRLRSNELKLERQLENTQAEISAYKKRMSSIEKDRMDLQSTIEALQEEKKLLQSKLRKASTSGNSIDATKPATNKKDISTSTEDLANEDATDTSSQEMRDGSFVGTGASSSSSLPMDGTSMVEDSFASIPPQQLRMIQNINTLLSELSLEKQELVQALASESSQSSKLKELNNELSRKLEAQTQRLELLTSQSMAGSGEHVSARLPDSLDVRDNIQYADEGDEVVERVLGWIMKLFPGGPSRRRASKLL